MKSSSIPTLLNAEDGAQHHEDACVALVVVPSTTAGGLRCRGAPVVDGVSQHCGLSAAGLSAVASLFMAEAAEALTVGPTAARLAMRAAISGRSRSIGPTGATFSIATPPPRVREKLDY